jgi:hypothetical protein
MVIYSTTIVPHETKKGWYRVTLTSEKAAWGMGQTKIELILDQATLRGIRNDIEKVIGKKSDEKLPENLRRFMDGE